MKDGGWEESSLEFINIYKVVHNKHPGFSLKQKLNHLKNLGSNSKESTCNAGDPGLIPGLGIYPREGHGNPLHYSCLENPMERGIWQLQATGCAELDMTQHTQHRHPGVHCTTVAKTWKQPTRPLTDEWIKV